MHTRIIASASRARSQPRLFCIDAESQRRKDNSSNSMAGYSGTSLVSKLGIHAGAAVYPRNAPHGYLDLLKPLPEDVTFVSRLSNTTDLVHTFCTRKADLAAFLKTCRSRLRPTAAVWVSWPKKSANVPSDITEDEIRKLALPLGFVDVKVCAVSDVWSGLKLVVRKELRS